MSSHQVPDQVDHSQKSSNREEIEAMLELQDLKQTRFYQEAFGDGIEQGIEQGINLQKLKKDFSL